MATLAIKDTVNGADILNAAGCFKDGLDDLYAALLGYNSEAKQTVQKEVWKIARGTDSTVDEGMPNFNSIIKGVILSQLKDAIIDDSINRTRCHPLRDSLGGAITYFTTECDNGVSTACDFYINGSLVHNKQDIEEKINEIIDDLIPY